MSKNSSNIFQIFIKSTIVLPYWSLTAVYNNDVPYNRKLQQTGDGLLYRSNLRYSTRPHLVENKRNLKRVRICISIKYICTNLKIDNR